MAQLKIIRIILHSDRLKMDREALKGECFWRHLRTSYGQRLPEYQARISKIITACAEDNPDIVLFPAATAIFKYHAQFEKYRAAMSKLPYIVFGALRVGQTHFKEHSEIWAHGKRLMKFDARWPIAVKLAGLPAVVAQSSTIKAVYQAPFLTLPAKRAPANPPYKLALDAGHGNYSGRYVKVFRRLKAMGMDALLSFWRNQNGQTNYPWMESPRAYSLRRQELAYGDYMDQLTFQDKQRR